MKEVNVNEVANTILEALPKGILLNSKADKFDSMVIGWGAMGTNWAVPIFTVYVRESRFTHEQLEKNPEFTISVPLNGIDAKINKVCGSMSGNDVDKEKEANLTLVGGQKVSVPAIKEYPLTLECKIIQKQLMDLSTLNEEFQKHYPNEESLKNGKKKDIHVAYTAQIVGAYILED